MINREYYITLKNELYNSNNITNEELVILSLIKRNYSPIKEISIISINMIMNYMYVLNRNSNMIKIIKNSINNLISKGYIKQIMNLHYRDRKSTRLNSSHANISYAVFCLKKKNKCIKTH